jgi:hypothetical protein
LASTNIKLLTFQNVKIGPIKIANYKRRKVSEQNSWPKDSSQFCPQKEINKSENKE